MGGGAGAGGGYKADRNAFISLTCRGVNFESLASLWEVLWEKKFKLLRSQLRLCAKK